METVEPHFPNCLDSLECSFRFSESGEGLRFFLIKFQVFPLTLMLVACQRAEISKDLAILERGKPTREVVLPSSRG